jgi:hypothetical protein
VIVVTGGFKVPKRHSKHSDRRSGDKKSGAAGAALGAGLFCRGPVNDEGPDLAP